MRDVDIGIVMCLGFPFIFVGYEYILCKTHTSINIGGAQCGIPTHLQLYGTKD